jgi:hypothetical protein
MEDLEKIDRFRGFLLEEDLDFSTYAFNSYND